MREPLPGAVRQRPLSVPALLSRQNTADLQRFVSRLKRRIGAAT
jgi:hypothetical protein